jgi:hypothetical protein
MLGDATRKNLSPMKNVQQKKRIKKTGYSHALQDKAPVKVLNE